MLYQPESKLAFDPNFSLDSVGWHKHSVDEFVTYVGLAIQRSVNEGPDAVKELEPYLLKWISNSKFLRHAWNHLAKYGGQAPGKNGLRFTDFDSEEVWLILKEISGMIRAGTYQPGVPKQVSFSKGFGKGDRTIAIPNVQDRPVARAVYEIALSLRDPFLSDCLYGGRRQKDRFLALAEVEHISALDGRWVWMTEDINAAFDKIPLDRLRKLLCKRWPCPKVVELIMRMTARQGKKGIYQGSSLSPYLLNEYLDRFLVEPFQKNQPETPLFVYMDDILVACPSMESANDSWKLTHARLSAAGLQIKGKKASDRVRNLDKGEVVEWLGYRIGKNSSSLSIKLTERSWENLGARLDHAHASPNSPLLAKAIVKGWLEQAGPCFEHESQEAVLAKIEQFALSLGFDEMPNSDSLLEVWESGFKRWQKVREQVANPDMPSGGTTVELPYEIPFDDGEAPF